MVMMYLYRAQFRFSEREIRYLKGNLPVLGLRMCFIAFLAFPLISAYLHYFLVATITHTSRIRYVFLLDINDSRFGSKVIRGLPHTKVFVLDLCQGLVRILPTSCSTHTRQSLMALEILRATLPVIPAPKSVRIVDVRIDCHGRTMYHAQSTTTKVTYFDTLKRDDLIGGGFPVLCNVTPDCETNQEACFVDESQVAFRVGFLGSLGGDGTDLADFFDNPDDIDHGIFLNRLKIGKRNKAETHLGNAIVYVVAL